MPLLNYTTQVPADKTVSEIQKELAKHGANAILNEYDKEGYIIALSFKMNLNDKDIAFKLPSDWRPVIVKDWVEAQMAIVETKMVKMQQVFLPYAVMRDGQTLSEKIINDPKFLLGQGDE